MVPREARVAGDVLRIGIRHPELQRVRREQHRVNVRIHAHRSLHQVARAHFRDAAEAVLHPRRQRLVTITRGQEHRVLDRVRQLRVTRVRQHYLELRRRRRDAHRAPRFAVRNHVVIFAGARPAPQDFHRLVQRARLLHHLAQQLRHRLAIPLSLAAPAHLADGDLFLVHRGDRADKTRVAHVHPRMAAVRLQDHHHRVLLQPDAFQIIQHAAVKNAPAARRLAPYGEAGAMEQLGEEIRQPRLLALDARRSRQRVHLAQIPLVHVRIQPLLRRLDLAEKPATLGKRAAHAHAIQHAVHEVPHLLAHQPPVLRAHLLRRAFEEQHPRPVAYFQAARALRRHHAPLARGRPERGNFRSEIRQGHREEPRDMPQRHRLHAPARERRYLPRRCRQRFAKLELLKLDHDVQSLAIGPPEAHRQPVPLPNPQVQRALGNLEGLHRRRQRRDAQHLAHFAADCFLGQQLDFGKQRQQRQLLARYAELERRQDRRIQFFRCGGEARHARHAAHAEQFRRRLRPQLLPVSPQRVPLPIDLRRQAQSVRRLPGQLQFAPEQLARNPLAPHDLDPRRQRPRCRALARFNDRRRRQQRRRQYFLRRLPLRRLRARREPRAQQNQGNEQKEETCFHRNQTVAGIKTMGAP